MEGNLIDAKLIFELSQKTNGRLSNRPRSNHMDNFIFSHGVGI